ncbi:hypothetical protein FOCC_FOCC005110 [Frankliniella occidentalis]|nr:hypothetical protein FOCC_FOCC005110 [Frankliniella occidentalis]
MHHVIDQTRDVEVGLVGEYNLRSLGSWFSRAIAKKKNRMEMKSLALKLYLPRLDKDWHVNRLYVDDYRENTANTAMFSRVTSSFAEECLNRNASQ